MQVIRTVQPRERKTTKTKTNVNRIIGSKSRRAYRSTKDVVYINTCKREISHEANEMEELVVGRRTRSSCSEVLILSCRFLLEWEGVRHPPDPVDPAKSGI